MADRESKGIRNDQNNDFGKIWNRENATRSNSKSKVSNSWIVRVSLILLGSISFIAGIIGLLLPLVPTTPFILLSAFCFARSSDRLHIWLLSQPKIGPLIQAWDEHGAIPRHIKILSTVMMSSMLIYPLIFGAISITIKGLILSLVMGVTLYIWTRPEI